MKTEIDLSQQSRQLVKEIVLPMLREEIDKTGNRIDDLLWSRLEPMLQARVDNLSVKLVVSLD